MAARIEDSGPPLSGVALVGKKWHHLEAVIDYATDPNHPKITGYKQDCNGGMVFDGLHAEIPGFISTPDRSAPLPVPEGEVVCAGCENIWRRRKAKPRLDEDRPARAELVEKSLQQILGALTEVSRLDSHPTIWRMKFGSRTYVADTKELHDPERFRNWWFEQFFEALTISPVPWQLVLERVGKLAEAVPPEHLEEEMGDEASMARESVHALLSTYRICADPKDVGVVVFHGAFQYDGKTWVKARELIEHLKKSGYKYDAGKAREALRGIVVGGSRVIRMNTMSGFIPIRCWPIDPKAAGLNLDVIPASEPNGKRLPASQTALDAPAETNKVGDAG